MPTNDLRLAPYAASFQPAWLWSSDGSRILWCNAAGAAVLGVPDPRRLEKPLSPTDPHRRQVAQLGRRLGSQTTPRLERLRGFGSRFGQLTTCSCARLAMADGETAILLVRMEPYTVAPTPAAPLPLSASAEANAPSLNETASREAQQADSPQTEHIEDHSEAEPIGTAPRPDEIASDRVEPTKVHSPAIDDAATAQALPPTPLQDPLRFVWQIDDSSCFTLTSDDFLNVAGPRTAAMQGHAWDEVATALGVDPHSYVAHAISQGETFSAIALHWPLEGHARGLVELSGMPVFDAARNPAGYRGFGIYRPQAVLADEPVPERVLAAEPEPEPVAEPEPAPLPAEPLQHSTFAAAAEAPAASDENPSHAETEIVEPPQNVVPFPIASDTRGPTLSAVENHAFDEIARRLTQKFDDLAAQRQTAPTEHADVSPSHGTPPTPQPHVEEPAHEASAARPAWLAAPAPPPRGDSGRERALLDLMPSGILIYRLDRLLYANRAFLQRTGFASLHALQEAGGLDALYVEPGPGTASSASDDGMPLTIAHSADDHAPSDARLFSILWDGDSAHALILQDTRTTSAAAPALQSEPPPDPIAAAAADNPYEAILERATDGIVLFDRSGAIISSNGSAQQLFDMSANELAAQNFAELFASDSQRVVLDYFESLEGRDESHHDLRDHGREVLGRTRTGGTASLSMTMGRTDGDHFFAVFRDLSPLKKSESDLLNARRNAERATSAKADALARISRDIRDPLNTIIGFASVIIDERFGALDNERYAAYLKDIRAAGERAIAVLDDVVSLSGIESGQVQLKLASQNLNEMVEQCVGVLQPQANRERVIIRTSLARALPQVLADTQALRQITMNIVTSSIRGSRAGGQVIVSTAPGENGGAILRVRDTGRGALPQATGLRGEGVDQGAIDLSLVRALAEANRAQFQIKATENAGTLIEVVFSNTRALAG